jgi:hypothetical protein
MPVDEGPFGSTNDASQYVPAAIQLLALNTSLGRSPRVRGPR